MRELLTSKLVAKHMEELGYTLVTDVWRGDPENKGLAKLEYFNDKNGERANGVVVRDGYPLDCILIEPGVNIYDEINGGIDVKALVYEGLDIYNVLRRKGDNVSMTPEGVVRYWATRRESDYDKYYRNSEVLTPKRFITIMKQTMGLLSEKNVEEALLLKDKTSEVITILKNNSPNDEKCREIIKCATPFKNRIVRSDDPNRPYIMEEQFIYHCRGLINYLKK